MHNEKKNQIFCFSECSNDTADKYFHNPREKIEHKMTVYAVKSSMHSRFSIWFVCKDKFSYQLPVSTVQTPVVEIQEKILIIQIL